MKTKEVVSFETFLKIDIRSGTVVRVETFPRARKPAFKVWVDFGPTLGVLQTSAQITQNYDQESLVSHLRYFISFYRNDLLV